MTGYTVHTGSNDKFRDGWDRVFSEGPKSSKKDSKAKTEKSKKSSKKKK